MTYNDLMAAAKLVTAARAVVNREDGMTISPAWRMLGHVEEHLLKQADAVMRHGEIDEADRTPSWNESACMGSMD